MASEVVPVRRAVSMYREYTSQPLKDIDCPCSQKCPWQLFAKGMLGRVFLPLSLSDSFFLCSSRKIADYPLYLCTETRPPNCLSIALSRHLMIP